jgi:hypothetical protein
MQVPCRSLSSPRKLDYSYLYKLKFLPRGKINGGGFRWGGPDFLDRGIVLPLSQSWQGGGRGHLEARPQRADFLPLEERPWGHEDLEGPQALEVVGQDRQLALANGRFHPIRQRIG